jgi:hypothetical protein
MGKEEDALPFREVIEVTGGIFGGFLSGKDYQLQAFLHRLGNDEPSGGQKQTRAEYFVGRKYSASQFGGSACTYQHSASLICSKAVQNPVHNSTPFLGAGIINGSSNFNKHLHQQSFNIIIG